MAHPKPTPSSSQQPLEYVKYTVPTTRTSRSQDRRSTAIITLESRNLILSAGTTGFRTWEAALHLATFLCSSSLVNKSSRVIELGAGTGFLSMFCAKHLGAGPVVATDCKEALLDGIRDCVSRNGIPGAVFPALWEWGQAPPSSSDGIQLESNKFDIGIGADLIYDVDLIPLLVCTIRGLFINHGIGTFVLSATLRNLDTFQSFLHASGKAGFTVERLDFMSPPMDMQTGFFHSTCVPIHTYAIYYHQRT